MAGENQCKAWQQTASLQQENGINVLNVTGSILYYHLSLCKKEFDYFDLLLLFQKCKLHRNCWEKHFSSAQTPFFLAILMGCYRNIQSFFHPSYALPVKNLYIIQVKLQIYENIKYIILTLNYEKRSCHQLLHLHS